MQTKDLKWQNLRRNKCAKCGDDLASHSSSLRLICKNAQCNWSISEEAFQRVVGNMNKEALDRPQFQDNDQGEDLRKAEPCNFCHTSHGPNERCSGFGQD